MPRNFEDIKISLRYAAYAVFEGFEPGVYTTWEAAEAQVKGYRKNKYKGFPSLEKASRAYNRHLKEKEMLSKPMPKTKPRSLKRKRNVNDDLPPWDID
jgi:ribonuclease HI